MLHPGAPDVAGAFGASAHAPSATCPPAPPVFLYAAAAAAVAAEAAAAAGAAALLDPATLLVLVSERRLYDEDSCRNEHEWDKVPAHLVAPTEAAFRDLWDGVTYFNHGVLCRAEPLQWSQRPRLERPLSLEEQLDVERLQIQEELGITQLEVERFRMQLGRMGACMDFALEADIASQGWDGCGSEWA